MKGILAAFLILNVIICAFTFVPPAIGAVGESYSGTSAQYEIPDNAIDISVKEGIIINRETRVKSGLLLDTLQKLVQVQYNDGSVEYVEVDKSTYDLPVETTVYSWKYNIPYIDSTYARRLESWCKSDVKRIGNTVMAVPYVLALIILLGIVSYHVEEKFQKTY